MSERKTYRRLRANDVIRRGDEYFCPVYRRWEKSGDAGYKVGDNGLEYRRPNRRKPAARKGMGGR